MIYTAAFKEHDSECFLKNTTQMFKCLRKKKKRKENSGKQTNKQKNNNPRLYKHRRQELNTLSPI